MPASDVPFSSPDEWAESVAREDWASTVAAALRRHFEDGRWLLEAAALLGVWPERDEDGTGVLCVVYQHPFWPERTGLRRRLDTPPPLSPDPGQTSAEWLASWIATFEISEPLGRMYDLLVEDENGVHWWGDSYRDLSEHPDFNGDMNGWLRRKLADLGARLSHKE